MSDITSFVVHLPGKPEHRDELETRLLDVLERMSEEPDFINTYLHRAADDPDTLVLYETWACSAEHFRAHHLGRPYRQAYEAVLPQLLARDRTIEFLTPVRTYERGALSASLAAVRPS
ncbi:oxidoreductase [Caballeronia jiangsuensis]|nr:oxidoreductase [Caballeronia jiangsuensis]